jgi:K+-transporting ATPase ATPase C chain
MARSIFRGQWRPALVGTAALIVLTGLVYPGLITGFAQVLFPRQANGSLVEVDGRVVGSALIGQTFTKAWYFHGRPSASGNDAAASAATNKGPTDLKLADTLIAGAVTTAIAEDGAVKGKVPSDMVTSSASGIDPHISPANARLQVARVAKARGRTDAEVTAVLDRRIEARTFGLLGEPRVNVLLLNIALDSAFGRVRDTTAAKRDSTAK